MRIAGSYRSSKRYLPPSTRRRNTTLSPTAPWLRLYREVLHDPKIVILTDKQFRAWVLMLCMVDPEDGRLPPIRILAAQLRMDIPDAQAAVDQLIDLHLVDVDMTNPADVKFIMHGWRTRQFRGDHTGAERMRKSRAKRKKAQREQKLSLRNSDVTVPQPPLYSVLTSQQNEQKDPSQGMNLVGGCGDADGQVEPRHDDTTGGDA